MANRLPGIVKRTAEPNAEYLQKLRDLIMSKSKDGELSDADIRAIMRAAAGYSGGKATARKRKAAEGDSLWIGYWIPPELASQIALEGGEAPADLHMTLVYLGKSESLPADAMERVTAICNALSLSLRPVDLCINGIARFSAEDTSGDEDVIYATVESDGIEEFRWRLVMALMDAGLYAMSDYDFTPHITLAYVVAGSDVGPISLPNVDVKLDALTISTGKDSTPESRVTFAIRGPAVMGYPIMMSEPISAMEPPATIPVLPVPGTYRHPVYGDIEMTEDRIASFVDNFKEGRYQDRIPIDLEHETKVSGAAGWITGLATNEDGSVDGTVEWTDRGIAALKADRFQYISPEWYDQWEDPITGNVHPDILIGAALTTRPFFKAPALRPLAASEMPGEGTMTTPNTENKPPEAAKAETPAPAPVAMSEDMVRRFAEMETQITALTADRDAHKVAAEAAANQSKTLAETVQTMQKNARRVRFTEEVTGKSASSAIRWYGEPDKHVSIMEHLADTAGEDSDIFKSYVETQRGLGEQMKSSALFAEIGTAGTGSGGTATAWDRILVKARELMASDPKMTEPVATTLVMERDSKLAGEYLAEVRGR